MHTRFYSLLTRLWRLIAVLGLVGGAALLACSPTNGRNLRQPTSETSDVQAPAAITSSIMDEDQRVYLWEIEHHGLLLVKQGFKTLSEAVRREDGPALMALLSPSFEGGMLQKPREVRAVNDYVELTR